ncbi:MAG: hypothetical protein WC770_06480 [Phycisphaerae bacterium]|jgi:hypothetical protein
MMTKMVPPNKSVLTVIIISILATAACAEVRQEQLASPATAQTFYDIGYELYASKDADFSSAMQAVIFLNAAINLDSRANYVLGDIINIAWQYPDRNFSDVVKLAFNQYIDRSTDLEIASKAVGYLLERLDNREQREQLLTVIAQQMTSKNAMFASDVLAQLGFLKAETADANDAQGYLMQAFAMNKYNRLAFAKLAELSENGGQPLPDIVYIQNFRYAVRSNPLDFDSAFSFSRYCQALGLYAPASAGYKYCAELSKYAGGKDSAEPALCRPWILSCYNAGQYDKCRDILWQVRNGGVFDVQVEAFAATAAKMAGDEQTAKAILDAMEARANKILAGELKVSAGETTDYAWFYTFADDSPNPDDMLTWATKAYDSDANSAIAASLFAYALVKNKQFDIAKPLLEKIGITLPSAGMAKAELLIQSQDSNSAVAILKGVVASAPGSFEAKKAAAKLKELGSEYISPVNVDVFNSALAGDFGQKFFSQFVEPQKMIGFEFKMQGATFSYGSEIKGNLVVVNNYTEPMIVSPDAMVKGNIRIDARIAGDLNEQIPALITKRVRPSYEIKPGSALFIPVRLDTGRVREILESYPQAELNLEFIAYLDPQMSKDGKITNLLKTSPARIVLKRRKLDLNTQYLQQKLDAIKKGHQGQKMQSAQLFAGLLTEQQKLRQNGTSYKFIYAEPELLSSALARCLVENDWVLKVQTMAAMQMLKLDYRMTEAVSKDLQNPYWPVRLIAVFILAKNQQNFTPVLAWTQQNDPHPLVRQMASILAGGSGLDEPKTNQQTDIQTSAKKTPEIVDGNSLSEPNANPQPDTQTPGQKVSDIADGNGIGEPNASPKTDTQKLVQDANEEKKN